MLCILIYILKSFWEKKRRALASAIKTVSNEDHIWEFGDESLSSFMLPELTICKFSFNLLRYVSAFVLNHSDYSIKQISAIVFASLRLENVWFYPLIKSPPPAKNTQPFHSAYLLFRWRTAPLTRNTQRTQNWKSTFIGDLTTGILTVRHLYLRQVNGLNSVSSSQWTKLLNTKTSLLHSETSHCGVKSVPHHCQLKLCMQQRVIMSL